MFDPRRTSCDGPAVKADWLEDLVWQDVRAFLANPAELLARVREQATEDDSGDLEERHASLTNRLTHSTARRAATSNSTAKGT